MARSASLQCIGFAAARYGRRFCTHRVSRPRAPCTGYGYINPCNHMSYTRDPAASSGIQIRQPPRLPELPIVGRRQPW